MRLAPAVILALLIAGCVSTAPFWTRAGASRAQLIDDSGSCYRASADDHFPAALPGPGAGARLLPSSEPPPELWTRSPGRAGLTRFDEQLRYERCMRERGWTASRRARLTR